VDFITTDAGRCIGCCVVQCALGEHARQGRLVGGGASGHGEALPAEDEVDAVLVLVGAVSHIDDRGVGERHLLAISVGVRDRLVEAVGPDGRREPRVTILVRYLHLEFEDGDKELLGTIGGGGGATQCMSGGGEERIGTCGGGGGGSEELLGTCGGGVAERLGTSGGVAERLGTSGGVAEATEFLQGSHVFEDGIAKGCLRGLHGSQVSSRERHGGCL